MVVNIKNYKAKNICRILIKSVKQTYVYILYVNLAWIKEGLIARES